MKLLRPLIRPLGERATTSRDGQTPAGDAAARKELAKERRRLEVAALRAERAAKKHAAELERASRKQRREQDRAERDTIAAHAFEHYLRVREWARGFRAADPAASAWTLAEQQVAAALQHLWDASPETIAALRRSCDPLGEARASDYDDQTEELSLRLRRDLQVLRKQMGPELFVQEPAALGGFGVVRNGERYHEETLKFFRVLAALHDGAVLGAFRGNATRSLVWEIGGGWGGFAYQFKTVCPNVTYLITGMPEALLVSAVYLMSLFPAARCRFYSEADADDLWRGWEDVDFVFAPEAAVPALCPPRVDITLDVMTLRDMDPDRVWRHVERAYAIGSRYFYSLLPASRAAVEAPRVWSTIERRYWIHPVPPRGVEGVTYPPVTTPSSGYAHIVGWSRIRL